MQHPGSGGLEECRNWQTILSNLLLKCKFDELLLLPKYYNKQKLHYKWHKVFNKVIVSYCLQCLLCAKLLHSDIIQFKDVDHHHNYCYPSPPSIPFLSLGDELNERFQLPLKKGSVWELAPCEQHLIAISNRQGILIHNV